MALSTFVSRVVFIPRHSVRSLSCLVEGFHIKRKKPVKLNYLFSPNCMFSMASYTAIEKGESNTLDYRVFFKDIIKNKFISPFHDIPLHATESGDGNIFHMVVEIPKWTNAKMEIATKESLNPIKQDVKKGNLRFVHNVFPHHGYIWNYGALPQTWEDPNHIDQSTGTKGDNDPVDVCEIGQRVANRGDVLNVKILGVFALIDEGETDWKLIAIDVNDPLASEINDIEDVELKMPGFLKATHEWFKIYKMPDGKPPNNFAFDGKPKDRTFALDVVNQTHEQWKHMMGASIAKGDINSDTTLANVGGNYVSEETASDTVDSHPDYKLSSIALDSFVDKWHYVSLQ